MSTNATLEPQIPSTFEEDILNYLRQQEREQLQTEAGSVPLPRAVSYSYSFSKSLSHSSYVRTILDDLLKAIERRGRLKEEYTRQLRQHNQYELFDLSKIIPFFHIGTETRFFKETILNCLLF